MTNSDRGFYQFPVCSALLISSTIKRQLNTGLVQMLDHLSPREFEEYCQFLMMSLYRCKVDLTQQTGDGGRDLLVHHSTGLWIIECKHSPNGTIGRPVVQKLHSATLTSNSCHALIITTGRFSKDAENYAQNLTDVDIKLIDMAKLAHMISVAFPNGALPTNLSVAIKTTPDATFPQVFAKSIFSLERFQCGNSTIKPVRVTRNTKYETYYIAEYIARGSVNSANGPFSESWQGFIWISENGSVIGFGSPNAHWPQIPPLVSFAEALATVSGMSAPPILQPHQATAKMKAFVSGNCSKSVWYKGRNNVNYSKTITPSASTIEIQDLKLCYIPFQKFDLRISNTSYEGELNERDSPPKFYVTCPELSTCTVCDTATTPTNQIICCVCFRPAHKWALLFPDSFECHQCKGIVCRNHTLSDAHGYSCKKCTVIGKPLGPRWLNLCIFGLVVTAVGLLSPLIAWVYFRLMQPDPTMVAFSHICLTAIIISLLSWTPFITIISQRFLLSRHKPLIYPKVE